MRSTTLSYFLDKQGSLKKEQKKTRQQDWYKHKFPEDNNIAEWWDGRKFMLRAKLILTKNLYLNYDTTFPFVLITFLSTFFSV